MIGLPATGISVRRLAQHSGVMRDGERIVPEEIPVAFSYGGSTHAVMMATPADLEDFAVGFSLTEEIISTAAEIKDIQIEVHGEGLDVQIQLMDDASDALRVRRRHMAGPVGCGLCGIESIEQALRTVKSVEQIQLAVCADDIVNSVAGLSSAQALNRQTHAVHGAGFYIPGEGLIATREDVGRHNALDKLVGAVLRGGRAGAEGIVAVTSRVSVEMVQKAALLGSPVLAAVSAPTALAIRTAQAAGITLAAVVRGNDFEIFTHPQRIRLEAISDVA